VDYRKKDVINRNRVRTNDESRWLSVPVDSRRGDLIKDVRIRDDLPWRRKHWRTIYASYQTSPYFGEYAGFFEDTYARRWERLADLNDHILRYLLSVLRIEVDILYASDFRFRGRGSGRVLDMCLRLGARTYLFGAGGRNYCDEASFRRAGVGVWYQDYRHPSYRQCGGAYLLPSKPALHPFFHGGPPG